MALSTLNGKYKNISSYLFFGEKKAGCIQNNFILLFILFYISYSATQR